MTPLHAYRNTLVKYPMKMVELYVERIDTGVCKVELFAKEHKRECIQSSSLQRSKQLNQSRWILCKGNHSHGWVMMSPGCSFCDDIAHWKWRVIIMWVGNQSRVSTWSSTINYWKTAEGEELHTLCNARGDERHHANSDTSCGGIKKASGTGRRHADIPAQYFLICISYNAL